MTSVCVCETGRKLYVTNSKFMCQRKWRDKCSVQFPSLIVSIYEFLDNSAIVPKLYVCTHEHHPNHTNYYTFAPLMIRSLAGWSTYAKTKRSDLVAMVAVGRTIVATFISFHKFAGDKFSLFVSNDWKTQLFHIQHLLRGDAYQMFHYFHFHFGCDNLKRIVTTWVFGKYNVWKCRKKYFQKCLLFGISYLGHVISAQHLPLTMKNAFPMPRHKNWQTHTHNHSHTPHNASLGKHLFQLRFVM